MDRKDLENARGKIQITEVKKKETNIFSRLITALALQILVTIFILQSEAIVCPLYIKILFIFTSIIILFLCFKKR
ncbi:MAG: hypothetical protein RR922_05780 [Clostridia bacterium]